MMDSTEEISREDFACIADFSKRMKWATPVRENDTVLLNDGELVLCVEQAEWGLLTTVYRSNSYMESPDADVIEVHRAPRLIDVLNAAAHHMLDMRLIAIYKAMLGPADFE